MNKTTLIILVGALAGAARAQCPNPSSGPDVIVGAISGFSNYGAVGGTAAYSLGTTACNVGDAEINWFANLNSHPVIAQNIYRLENGRFEQIGLSYLKHGFSALQQNLCCTCQSSGTPTRLGVGCSDTYGSGLNGFQDNLGPRWQVNAHTGNFAYPFSQQGESGDAIFKRIQVLNDDVDPALHPTATYFGEAQYVAPDDAGAGNGLNNVSWIDLDRSGTQTGGAWRLHIGGATHREEPALMAWRASHPAVNLVEVDVPGEGRFVVGSLAVDNGDGTWNYEYAIFNNTSDFSGGSFAIGTGDAVLTNPGMSFPHYHSGEPYTNTPWTITMGVGSIEWSTDDFATDPNANALRWGTTYSFWFTSDAPPAMVPAGLGLFKPGHPGDPSFMVDGPSGGGGVFVQHYCPPNPNSIGQQGAIDATNFDLVGRTFDLDATQMPANEIGYFLASMTESFTANPGGSAGNLCLGGDIGRGAAGGVMNTGASGSIGGQLDMNTVPQPAGTAAIMAGQTWSFQAWHRDTVLGIPTSNFTSGVRITLL